MKQDAIEKAITDMKAKERFPDTLAVGGLVPPAKGKEGWRTPKGAVESNKSGLAALGHNVLLAAPELETVTKGGLIIPAKTAEAEQMLSVWATVIEIGHEAWSDKSTDFCAVGDEVMVGKYTGMFVTGKKDGKSYRFIKDLDIITRAVE